MPILAGQRRVLQGKHHLHQRLPIHAALRVEFLDQLLERQVLMGVGFQAEAPGLLQQIRETGVLGEVGAQGQSVDEKSDQALDFAAMAVGHRRANDDVGGTAVAAHEGTEGGLQHHEESDAPLIAQLAQGRQQLAGQNSANFAGAETLGGRSREIIGQTQQGRSAAQLLPPIIQLTLQHGTADPGPLPEREISVLDGQLRQLDRGVEIGQFRQQHTG